MSSPNHPTSDIEDAFSSNSPDYISASPNYFPASPGNTSSNFLDDVMQVYDATNNELPIPQLQAPIAPPTILPPSAVLSLSQMFDSEHFFPPEKISPSKDAETSVESPIPIYPSSSVG
nr:hypothetical protein [Tanacetum cinerariifolium]